MCDLGGDISCDLGTWQCACCGRGINDLDVRAGNVKGLCDIGICSSCRNAPDEWIDFVQSEWDTGTCDLCNSPCELKR
jgi:hypothetical protein